MRPRVKICCISNADEVERAVAAGADALGFVSAMPSGPGVLNAERIEALLPTVPPPVAPVVLTSAQDPATIVAQQRRLRAAVLQLVDHVDPEHYATLRAALPGTKLMQVVHVTGPDAVPRAAGLDGQVDAVLLDSGRPDADVAELGGTGRTHDWDLSRAIVERLSTPVFLAGGLHADNVADALRSVRPFGVDLCSGVRTNGVLDGSKLRAFMRAVRQTAARLGTSRSA
jgi:phosphoribosylanthranilate isomerase